MGGASRAYASTRCYFTYPVLLPLSKDWLMLSTTSFRPETVRPAGSAPTLPPSTWFAKARTCATVYPFSGRIEREGRQGWCRSIASGRST